MRLNCSKFLFVFICSAFLFTSCTTSQVASNSSPTSTPTQTSSESSTAIGSETASPETTTVSENGSESIPGFKELPRLEGKATVVMIVKGSPITIDVDGTNAPITAGNFVDLVQRGVYNGLMFHRVERDPSPFVVQGGDPQSKDPKVPVTDLGTGSFIDPKTNKIRYIPLEIKPLGSEKPLYSKTFKDAAVTQQPVLKHKRGAVAMARSQMPDSASSQFYFALSDLPPLDGSYAVFGYVREGMDVVDKIQQGDRIDSAKVTQGAENLK
ncbi:MULTISPECIES: peptidylprolyl isomerase [Nostocales]|uniref:Peptidyl-prolyl cis-trans isomerase n=3 Tax=Nostocales TaxID=1161 RepID=A0A0C1QZN5_9CYAN|nr:peptidylprolyl isomerase [Tolypothrix bouteillei]KAF3885282.1 peptidylprolyl isomerase [Tolypothrix bouteillei VB521301]